MAENKLENLEKEVKELIKLSQQLKEVNDHLSKKNILLSKENNQLTQNLDVAKEGISKIIKFISNKSVQFQTGYIYDYAFVMLVGLSALITYLILN